MFKFSFCAIRAAGEGHGGRDVDSLPGHGVRELNFGGVEHEPFGGFAVKIVAHNGAAQSRLMCRVNAQLVRASCLGVEIHKRAPLATADDRIAG